MHEKKEDEIDWESALYHEEHAAELGELEAILTMAKLYLGQEKDVLANCTVQVRTKQNHSFFLILSHLTFDI